MIMFWEAIALFFGTGALVWALWIVIRLWLSRE